MCSGGARLPRASRFSGATSRLKGQQTLPVAFELVSEAIDRTCRPQRARGNRLGSCTLPPCSRTRKHATRRWLSVCRCRVARARPCWKHGKWALTCYDKIRAPLAQSAEHIHGKDGVAGSIPAGGSTPRLTSGNAGQFRVWGPVERAMLVVLAFRVGGWAHAGWRALPWSTVRVLDEAYGPVGHALDDQPGDLPFPLAEHSERVLPAAPPHQARLPSRRSRCGAGRQRRW